jgi:hypothetical protein
MAHENERLQERTGRVDGPVGAVQHIDPLLRQGGHLGTQPFVLDQVARLSFKQVAQAAPGLVDVTAKPLQVGMDEGRNLGHDQPGQGGDYRTDKAVDLVQKPAHAASR